MANDDFEGLPKKEGSSAGADSDGFLGDALKKLISTGVTAAFMTEEAIRSRVSERGRRRPESRQQNTRVSGGLHLQSSRICRYGLAGYLSAGFLKKFARQML